ncbi:DUF5684 domain-containing protein [Microbacterium sp. 2FI]|uniref:DUF5684 domain-containing protein n=1 Tax=Microbacterium sp. 2FI TaxID=2502193 RepID=UPI0010FA57B3|nr:DUF5684 domain-containing protein [Microbacterium sp. 2FI]
MTPVDDSTAVALGLVSLVFWLALYVWTSLALAAVFRKSGVQGWKAWVPVLNLVVLFQLGGFSGWLLLIGLVPIVGVLVVVVIEIIACYRIGVAFGYRGGMAVVAALLFPVWASIIGFGSARWVGRDADAGPRRSENAAGDDLPPLPPFPTPGEQTAATYSPIAPPPAYGRAPQAPAAPAPQVTPPPGGWAPPPLPQRPAVAGAAAPAAPASPFVPAEKAADDPWQGFAVAGLDLTGEVTGAVSGAPEPIAAVPVSAASDAPSDDDAYAGPRRSGAASESEPEAASQLEHDDAPEPVAYAPARVVEPPVDTPAGLTLPPVTRVPAARSTSVEDEPWAPARSPQSDPEAFPETSGPVSAIAGAPDAGSPRSARSSVSALHTRPEIPDDAIEETIIARRRRTHWSLVLPSGEPVALGGDVVILGRRPVADSAFPGAQLVAIEDGTVSKTHARLELRDDTWFVTDLDSTNGVLFATVLGTEVEVTPGVETEAGDRFLLGDAEVRLVRSDA